MSDTPLSDRLLDAVLGRNGSQEDDELESELSDRPEALDEYGRLQNAWNELGRLPVHEVPEEFRRWGERELRRAAKARAQRRGLSWILTSAAAVLLFVGGLALGLWVRPVAPSLPSAEDPNVVEGEAEGRYVLLIRGGAPPEGEAAGVEAMTEWARELWSEGRLVWAERLASEASTSVGGSDGPLSGLFVIRARDGRDAARFAGQAPHLRWGGSVEVLPTGVAPEG